MLLYPIQSIKAPGPMSTGTYDSCLPVGGRNARRGEHDAPMGGATLSPLRPGPHQILNKMTSGPRQKMTSVTRPHQ